MTHYLKRINPKGEKFVGQCEHCGEQGGFSIMDDLCPGPPHSSEDDLLDALQ